MDGLSQYKAKVDCSEKIELEGENAEKLIFLGEKWKSTTHIISPMTAMKCLRKDCEAYLVPVIDKEKQEVSLKDLPIVNEFNDVFLEDLPGLPLKREIEFEIELLPRGSSIV